MAAPVAEVAPTDIEKLGDRYGTPAVRDRVYRRALGFADVAAVMLALVLCVGILGDDRLRLLAFLGMPVIVVVAKLQGLYDRDELLISKSTLEEAPRLFQFAGLVTVTLWLMDGALVAGALGKTQILVLWGSLFVLLVCGRFWARWVAGRITPVERCLFVGDSDSCERLRVKLGPRTELVAQMSVDAGGHLAGGHVVAEQGLLRMLRETKADRVVIAPETLSIEDTLDLVRTAKSTGVHVSLLPRFLDVVGTSLVVDEVQGMTLLGARRFRLTRSSAALKRAFDLVGATVTLVVAAPVLAAIMAAIKLDSRGPVLFRQKRVGRDGTVFRICKFRTMCTDAEARKAELREHNECLDGLFKIADDPRITRVGRFLRRTSLDELPQLFNVLAGHMSLVGPRPLVPDEDERIRGHDRFRLTLTPGMTGHWQILGSSRVPLAEMVKIDYLYVAGWSVWTDVKILARTVPYVRSRAGL